MLHPMALQLRKHETHNNHRVLKAETLNPKVALPVAGTTKNSTYVYTICERARDNELSWKFHFKRHMAAGAPSECDICLELESSSSSSNELSSHIPLHDCYAELPYACDQCDATFPYPAQLMIHQTEIHDPTPYKCTICEKYFQMRKTLNQHMANLHKPNERKRGGIDLDEELPQRLKALFQCASNSEAQKELLEPVDIRVDTPGGVIGDVFLITEAPSIEEITCLHRNAELQHVHTRVGNARKTEGSQEPTEVNSKGSHIASSEAQHDGIKLKIEKPESFDATMTSNSTDDLLVHAEDQNYLHETTCYSHKDQVNLSSIEWTTSHDLPIQPENIKAEEANDETLNFRDSQRTEAASALEANIKVESAEETLNQARGAIAPNVREMSHVSPGYGHQNDFGLYACEFCPRSYTAFSRLQSHMSSHENDKDLPYNCDLCGASFAYPFKLNEHRVSHLDDVYPRPVRRAAVRTFTYTKKRLGSNRKMCRNQN